MTKRTSIAIAATALTAAVASFANPVAADPAADTSADFHFAASAPNAGTAEDGDKREATGYALSIGGSLFGSALLLAGALWTHDGLTVATGVAASIALPSAGHWYAHQVSAGPMLLRGAGAAIMALAFVGDPDGTNAPANGYKPIVLGGAVMVAGAIWDIATAGTTVRDYNHERHLDVSIVPTMMRTANNSYSTGLALSGSF